MNRRLVLIGPPGTGKGTQAQMLSEEWKIPHISTGSLLREAVESGSELGGVVEQYMRSGELVPDNIMLDVVKERLSHNDVSGGFILDGFPRTIEQAEGLDRTGIDIDRVVYIYVDEDEIIRRLLSRYECPKCGYIKGAENNKEDVCPKCGVKLVRRADDDIDIIKKRLKVYREQTEPLLDHYKDRGIMLEVDGNGTVEEVFRRIEKGLMDEDKHQE